MTSQTRATLKSYFNTNDQPTEAQFADLIDSAVSVSEETALFPLLAGRAGGQTLYGGTGANDDITIHGTSDATRTTSYVLLQPSGGNVGIGASTTLLHKLTIGVGTNNIAFEGGAGVPYGGFGWDQALDALVLKVNTGANDLNASPLVVQRVSGNVGINATTPTTALHVVGAVTVTGGIRPAADGTTALQLQTAAGASVLNVDTTNGRVGIGTAGPGDKLAVNGWIRAYAGSASDGGFSAYDAMTGGNHLFSLRRGIGTNNLSISSYDSIGFTGNATGGPSDLYQVFIKNDGGVGIGTTSPATALHVVGAATVTGGIRPAADGTTALQLQNASGTSILDVDTTNARVGIGAASPAAKLHVDQSGSTATIPVLIVEQNDVSEEFIHFVGTSTTDASQSLVDAADMPVPGSLKGWLKIYVTDKASSGAIDDGVYWIPFYSDPTA